MYNEQETGYRKYKEVGRVQGLNNSEIIVSEVNDGTYSIARLKTWSNGTKTFLSNAINVNKEQLADLKQILYYL